jgi:hypothetical protein
VGPAHLSLQNLPMWHSWIAKTELYNFRLSNKEVL